MIIFSNYISKLHNADQHTKDLFIQCYGEPMDAKRATIARKEEEEEEE